MHSTSSMTPVDEDDISFPSTQVRKPTFATQASQKITPGNKTIPQGTSGKMPATPCPPRSIKNENVNPHQGTPSASGGKKNLTRRGTAKSAQLVPDSDADSERDSDDPDHDEETRAKRQKIEAGYGFDDLDEPMPKYEAKDEKKAKKEESTPSKTEEHDELASEAGEKAEAGDESMEYEDFDPSAAIQRFAEQVELGEKWDKIQGELAPFLKKWVEQTLTNTFDHVLAVLELYNKMNVDAQTNLSDGVKAIKAEEQKQVKAQNVISSFSGIMDNASRAFGA